MKELFATCSRAGKFKWEMVATGGKVKYHDRPVEVQQEVPYGDQDQGYDPYGQNESTDPSAVSFFAPWRRSS
jgi:hypothetical protein